MLLPKERAMAVTDVKRKMLGEMLVAGGMIKEEQLKRALDEQKKRGGKLGEILVDLRFISEHNIAAFSAGSFTYPISRSRNSSWTPIR